MKIELSEDTIYRLATLAYDDWAKTWDARKAVQAETDDGSKDWALFHAERLKGADARLATTKRVLDEISNAARGIIEGMMPNG